MRTAYYNSSDASGRWRRRFRELSLCFAIAVMGFGCSSPAEVTHLAPAQRTVLEDAAHFTEIHSVKNLPAEVVALCHAGTNGLADPGQKWEESDFIRDEKLPRKRLIWAAVSGDYTVVHYEAGGFALTHHIFLARYKAGDATAKLLWRATGGPFTNYNDFLDGLKKNKLDDDPAINP